MIQKDYIEKVYAGIVGKAIGVRYGAPIEQWWYEGIRDKYGEISDYLVDYKDFAADDDTNGPLFFLRALQDSTYTSDITAKDIGDAWLNYAPFEHAFYWWGGYGVGSEHTAYLNLRNKIHAPRSGSIEQNGTAVAEQIGGQIFIDTWGLIAPGKPELAAEYAEKAASVSHDRNGKYGGMFIAAMIAQAFVEKDIYKLIEAGLKQIPADCEYTKMTRDVIRYYKEENSTDWRKAYLWVREHYGYHLYEGTCHIIPNSAVIILSLLFGEGDFNKTLSICNMCGWDTDCNVGNLGTIMGVREGLKGIEYRWRKPINDFIACSSVIGSLNIMDLPWAALYVADFGYKIAGEKMPSPYYEYYNTKGKLFHFEFEGSTHGIRCWSDFEKFEFERENIKDGGITGNALKVDVKTEKDKEIRIFHKTYYRPRDFYDSRYDPCFSPILYPGQTVKISFKASNAKNACVYIKDGNSANIHTSQTVDVTGDWQTIVYDIGYMSGVCIEEAGLKFNACDENVSVLIDSIRFYNKPRYELDFTKEKLDHWHGCHVEVAQFTKVKGHLTLENGELSASCADFLEAYTGSIDWEDYTFEATMQPHLGKRSGINFRVQGAIRSYGLFLCEKGLSLCKNQDDYIELKTVDFDWEHYKDYRFKVCLEGNNIKVYHKNELLIDYTDNNKPYLNGSVGVSVYNGSHCHYKNFIIG